MRQIKDCAGYYITEDGEVFTDRYGKLRQMKCNDNKGYRQITFNINKKRKYFKVHRLVAEAYIPNPLNLPQVNHINGVKDDNRVENLEWCDAQRNSELANAKVHRVENVATGEIVEVYNLNKWCRDKGLIYQSLWRTTRDSLQYRGWRLV